MHILVLKATYELRVSRKSHLRDHRSVGVMNPRVLLFIPINNENSFLGPRCELWRWRNGNNKWQDQTLFKGTVSRKSYFVQSFLVESIEFIWLHLHLIFKILLLRTLLSLFSQFLLFNYHAHAPFLQHMRYKLPCFLTVLWSVMIYCSSGYGSAFGKVPVPVPVPDPDNI